MVWGTYRRRRRCREIAGGTSPKDAARREVYRLLISAHKISRKQNWVMLCYLISMALVEAEAMAALMDRSDD